MDDFKLPLAPGIYLYERDVFGEGREVSALMVLKDRSWPVRIIGSDCIFKWVDVARWQKSKKEDPVYGQNMKILEKVH